MLVNRRQFMKLTAVLLGWSLVPSPIKTAVSLTAPLPLPPSPAAWSIPWTVAVNPPIHKTYFPFAPHQTD